MSYWINKVYIIIKNGLSFGATMKVPVIPLVAIQAASKSLPTDCIVKT